MRYAYVLNLRARIRNSHVISIAPSLVSFLDHPNEPLAPGWYGNETYIPRPEATPSGDRKRQQIKG